MEVVLLVVENLPVVAVISIVIAWGIGALHDVRRTRELLEW